MKDEKKIGAILGYLYTALQSIISIVYIPILLNGIGKSEYGLYQIVGSVIAYFSAMEGPLCASILKFYVEYKVKKDEKNMENVLAIGQRIFFMLSLAMLLITVPAIFLLNGLYSSTLTDSELREAVLMLCIMVINIIIYLNNYVYLAVINGNEKFVFLKLTSIATLIVQPILVILVIQHFQYAFVIVAVQCLMNIIMAYVRQYYAKRILKCSIKYHGFDKVLFKSMMTLTFANFGVALADQIFWKTDQLILGSIYGPEVVSEYSIGSQLNAMYISVACVLGGVILPTITKILVHGSSDDLSYYFSKVGRYQSFLVVLVLFGVVSFGKEFIFLLAGDGFEISFVVALLLMVPYSIDLIQICGATIMQAKNQYSYRANFMIIAAFFNVGLTLLWIKIVGPIGAALSTGLVIFLGNGVYLNYIYYKKFGLNIMFFFRSIYKIWIVGLFMIPVSFFINKIDVSNIYMNFILHILIFTFVYLFFIYRFTLYDTEKKQIHLFLTKFCSK